MLAFSGHAWAQPAEPVASDGLAPLKNFLAEVDSLTAEFSQELWTADQRLLETAMGTLSLQRPNRFSWRYSKPIEQLVLADGENLWMYDVELEQATVTPLDESGASSPALLLSGDANVSDNFELIRGFAADGLDWIELQPKVAGTDFSSILIGFRERIPERLELRDGLNQQTLIEFSGIVVNPTLPDATFRFDPPPGVDVIGGG